MNINFIYQSIAEEVELKEHSLVSEYTPIEKQLLEDVSKKGFSKDQLEQLDNVLSFIKNLESNCEFHPSWDVYLTHPYRIAYYISQLYPDYDLQIIMMALMHNVYEVTKLEVSDLTTAGIDPFIASSLQLLTINREKQKDIEYLEQFYSAISNHSNELALLRCVDKLDNLLALSVLEEGERKSSYIELAERFVTPIAASIDTRFGEFFAEVCVYARTVPYNPSLKKKMDSLMGING
jgi:(p)ppGpp synthase/HD superfamily hydrolase